MPKLCVLSFIVHQSINFIINDIGHLKKESIGLVRLRESKGLLNYSSKVMKRRQRTPKK